MDRDSGRNRWSGAPIGLASGYGPPVPPLERPGRYQARSASEPEIGARRERCGIAPGLEPGFDVTAPEAHVPAHTKAARTPATLAPPVDRLPRNLQVLGGLANGHQTGRLRAPVGFRSRR